MYFTFAAGNYRENLALRHPCNPINKLLGPYIAWTEKLASSQYKVQRDACGQLGSGPACCTHEILNSYASNLDIELKTIFDAELNQLTKLFASTKQQIDIWSKEYVIELRRLTTSSLETLFGTKEYRSNVHHSVVTLFKTLSDGHSSDDNVSRSVIALFNHLIISFYRRFMIHNDQLLLDDKFQKCLINKAFDIEALPTQRELLYTLTSGSTLVHIFRTMLLYIDADIQRLKSTATMSSNQCTQRYARETLCPMCVGTSSFSNQFNKNNDVNEPLCENDCRYVIKTCFNQTNNPYIAFSSIAKGYSVIIKEIEQAVVELKLVERLSKLHIYLYDMVINATNTQYTYTQLQTACPNPNTKPFSPVLSVPPITTERRELVSKWNRSVHFLLNQLRSSIYNLNTKFTQQIITDICSNSNYAVKSNQCTQIDKQPNNRVIQWPLPSIPQATLNLNDAELTRNQLDELKKKMTPIQQMILSLKPKKKYSLIEYIPNFDSYTDDSNINDGNNIQSASFIETYDNDIQGSLSERLYKEIDGQTTRRSNPIKVKYPNQEDANHCQLITYSIVLYLTVFIIHRILHIDQ